jgi:hypothetical protein
VIVESNRVAWRDWFARRLSSALDALRATESSRGPVGIVLGRRRAVGAVEIKGAVATERWRRYWLSLTVIRFSSVSNDWHEAVSSV